jgi:hypothetical protein
VIHGTISEIVAGNVTAADAEQLGPGSRCVDLIVKG